jgi:thiol-disulfide isomerase/thioredoxin
MKRSAVLMSLVVLAAVAMAADSTPSPQYLLTGKYQVQIDGQRDKEAQVYATEKGVPQFLIVSPVLEQPWLVVAGSRTAGRLPADAVEPVEDDPDARRVTAPPDGTVPAALEKMTLQFPTDHGTVALAPREPLIGEHTADALLGEVPEYRRTAAAYAPGPGQLRLLEQVEQPVDVDVFFGTWCTHCRRIVPRVAKLDQALDGDKVRFHFWGLPRDFGTDPIARQYDIVGVPTVVVRREGEILGRLEGGDLLAPEKALASVLFGGAS